MTSSWLHVLPHQIPFRAASTGRRIDERTIEGTFLCTANDMLAPGPAPLELMVVEAMAQLAGGLSFHETRGHGFLTGIDRCTIDRAIVPGDVVTITVTLDAEFGGTFRFAGSGSIEGVEVLRGRFYLASPEIAGNS